MVDEAVSIQGLVCPVPYPHQDQIVMAHGSGGKMGHDLIKSVFMSSFDNSYLRPSNDAARLEIDANTLLSISTDSHVVWPLFFPGGDIGRLAICGTVNDIAMLGAKPLYITSGFILEEGLNLSILQRVVNSMQLAADEAGVQIVAGDTKVVQKGKADGLYITTSGVGVIKPEIDIGGQNARPGDTVLLSGSIGDHGIAVLSARGELGFEAEVQSDVAPLNHLIEQMLAVTQDIHVLRDPTRGGLATSLTEIALQSDVGIVIEEGSIPINAAVSAACELLGFDPLYVANEGKLISIVAADDAPKVLSAMQAHPYGAGAVKIGRVTADHPGRVLMKTNFGSTRVVDMLSGELLPRIC